MRSILGIIGCVICLSLPSAAAGAWVRDKTDYSDYTLQAVEDSFFKHLLKNGVLAYRNMNNIVWESSFWPMLKKRFGCLRSDASGSYRQQWTLADDLTTFFGGAPEALFTVRGGRYLIGSACRYHSCTERAIMIADTQDRQIAYGLLHYFSWTDGRLGKRNARVPSGLVSVFVDPSASPEFAAFAAHKTQAWAWEYRRNAYFRRPEERPKAPLPALIYAVRCQP